MDKRKVIFDGDTGTDDAVALIALLLADNVDVIGITSVHGNRPVNNTTDNNLRVVQFMGKEIPVYKGCGQAMVRHLTPGRDKNTIMQKLKAIVDGKEIRIHDATLDLPAPAKSEERMHACAYLVDTLMHADTPIDIVAVGPLTNIGMALTMQPEIVKNIGTIYIMGGGLYKGNRTPVAEANFYDDPEAAEIVLNCGAHVLLNPIEPNVEAATYTKADVEDLKAIGTKSALFVADLIEKFLWRSLHLFGDDSEVCIHDYAAAAPLIDPATVTETKREVCHVDFYGGMSDGMLVVDRRQAPNEKNPVEVVYHMDGERTHKLLSDLLKKY